MLMVKKLGLCCRSVVPLGGGWPGVQLDEESLQGWQTLRAAAVAARLGAGAASYGASARLEER
jgi:hypothetical protein